MTQLGPAKILRIDVASGVGTVVDVRVTCVDENTVTYVLDGKERTTARTAFEAAEERATESMRQRRAG